VVGSETGIGISPEEGGDSKLRADGTESRVFDEVGGRLCTLLNFYLITASAMNTGIAEVRMNRCPDSRARVKGQWSSIVKA